MYWPYWQGTGAGTTNLRLFSALKLGIGFTNKVEIFFVKSFFLFPLGSPSLLAPATFALVGIPSFIFFVLINDEAFANLCHTKGQLFNSSLGNPQPYM